jgi:tRNA (guanine37-N1)-methyltransferase
VIQFGPPTHRRAIFLPNPYLGRILAMKFDIITIFPDIFSGFISESLISKALKKRLISIRTHYLRKWTTDRHATVDGKRTAGVRGSS